MVSVKNVICHRPEFRTFRCSVINKSPNDNTMRITRVSARSERGRPSDKRSEGDPSFLFRRARTLSLFTPRAKRETKVTCFYHPKYHNGKFAKRIGASFLWRHVCQSVFKDNLKTQTGKLFQPFLDLCTLQMLYFW